jgi:sulfate adenylyltransferase large subunit
MAPLAPSGTSTLAERTGIDLLRFAAIGSVDDGKSTLIGRLLVDTRQLFDDQLEAVGAASRRRGGTEMDLAFVTDGLRSEREQGITIDVAYRYAATATRKFVIADCPGHVQYTANMATGASTADLGLVVVDVTAGLREQTRRHTCIAALLGVDQLVVAANKMDLVSWRQEPYEAAKAQMEALARRLGIRSSAVVPVSALHGDNVVARSDAAPFYRGPSVLEALESAPAGTWSALRDVGAGAGARLPVQWVLRHGNGRSYAGILDGGPLSVGDDVIVLPGGHRTTVSALGTYDGPIREASVGLAVSVEVADDLDVGRGDLIAAASDPPTVTSNLGATVCWFGHRPLAVGDRFQVKHTTRVAPARVTEIVARLDVHDLALVTTTGLDDNEIGVIRLSTGTPLAVDPYARSRVTGSFVLVDEATNATLAAGMVGPPSLVPGHREQAG